MWLFLHWGICAEELWFSCAGCPALRRGRYQWNLHLEERGMDVHGVPLLRDCSAVVWCGKGGDLCGKAVLTGAGGGVISGIRRGFSAVTLSH